MRKEGVEFVIHYLHDFLLLGCPGSEECATALEKLQGVFHGLSLPVAPDKLEGLTTKLVFLEFELDTVATEVRLPTHKLEEVKELVRHWQARKSCTMKELESLTGKLSHAAQVVQPGKIFLRRMHEPKAKMGSLEGGLGSTRFRLNTQELLQLCSP